MIPTQSSAAQPGISVSTAIAASGREINHAGGVVVSTAIAAGRDGGSLNHAEGLVLR